MSETAYQAARPRLEHAYGPNVHLLADPWALTVAARLASPETPAIEFHHLLRAAFHHLFRAVAEQLPTTNVRMATRMTAKHADAAYEGLILDPKAPVVVVDIARGGMIPSHLFQLALLEVLDPAAIRVDHIYAQRVSDDITGHVTGVFAAGSKIGGPVAGSTLIVPDPMGATGRSVEHVLRGYQEMAGGPPKKIVTCHLIVTPEYLWRVTRAFPEVQVYALRLDRGLSAPDVLATPPGTRWAEEKGLDDHDYIVPGAGGLGEVINNAFV